MQRPTYDSELLSEGLPDGAGEQLAKASPLLWHFLCDCKWDDGTDRLPGTVLLLFQDGLLKAWLNDKAVRKTCWVSSDTWGGLLKACQKALEGHGGEWRNDKGPPAARSRKGS